MAESDTGETFAFDSVSFERKASDAAYSDMCGKVKDYRVTHQDGKKPLLT